MKTHATFIVFAGQRCLASGSLEEAVRKAKAYLDATRKNGEPVLVFDDRTGDQIDFDLRGTLDEAIDRLASHPLFAINAANGTTRRGPGRPKLGVISREVSLLPRHWDWLEQQRGGMSVALRSMVEQAMKTVNHGHLARKAREAAGKFMWTMAGNLRHFEEASRALYAKDQPRLKRLIQKWPKDIKKHVERLVAEAVRLESSAAH